MNNLPIPQSRSEELMNAFIQRDSSQISTPQSRIEEFWYHLIEGTNSLPIPQSRNELLLKKIIENDTHQIPLAQSRTEEFLVSILTGDINKLPIPQSRSEYYLDYIARNNLLLNDIDYVRYSGTNITATNTVQKPFRSAILSGQTLVNLFQGHGFLVDHNNIYTSYNNGIYTYQAKETFEGNIAPANMLGMRLHYKPIIGKTYTVFVTQVAGGNSRLAFVLRQQDGVSAQIYEERSATNGLHKFTFTHNYEGEYNSIELRLTSYTNERSIQFKDIMLIEGDYTNVDISYFTGMTSCKMPDLSEYHVYSYKDVTHYDCSSAEGSLVPTLSIDVPTHLPAVVTRQRATIQELEKENVALKNEIVETAKSSVSGDLELMSSQFELDFRLFEIEMNLDMPMALNTRNARGAKAMAMTVYQQAKTLILAGKYEREDMEYKLNRYKSAGRITVEEYDELIALMDARELVD